MVAVRCDAVTLCEDIIRRGFAPPSTLPEWRWMEENIELDNTAALPGKYSTELVPMVRSYCNWRQNPRVRRLTKMVSAQSTKTQNAINSLLHDIAEDPGPTMWVGATADNAEEFAKKRLFPAVETCPKTAPLVPKERKRRSKKLIQFDSMNLMLRGANSRIGLQSDPVRRIYCDERREWKPGSIDLVRKRTRTFHNSIEISMGVAGEENDELHTDFKEGNQLFFHFTCPKCQHSQPFRFGRHSSVLFPKDRNCGGVVWDTNETTKPGGKWVEADGERRYVGGVWNLKEFKKTVRYECENEQCKARFRNAEKAKLLKTVHEVAYNQDAPAHLVSMHWNALYMPWASCDWAEIAENFLKAWAQAKRGNLLPLIEFVTEDLGEPWQEVIFFSPRPVEKVKSDYRVGGADLRPGQFWALEHTRYMTIDPQVDHFWHTSRAFTKDGESRLVSWGKLLTWEQIRDKQTELGVADDHVIVDCGNDIAGVAEQCCIWGWRMMRGDDATTFSHFINKKRILLPYSVPQKYDPYIGKKTIPRKYRFAIWVRWSNPSIKDFLWRLQTGQGLYWGLPADIDQIYLDQINGERKKEVRNKNTNRLEKRWVEVGRHGCHMRDCECMALVCAVLEALLAGQPIVPEAEAA